MATNTLSGNAFGSTNLHFFKCFFNSNKNLQVYKLNCLNGCVYYLLGLFKLIKNL